MSFVSCRDVLWYLVLFGFAVNYLVRININIAIVAMVRNRTASENNTLNSSSDDKLRFDWDEHEQGLILGGFFWLHWLMQIPGGLLSRRYGTKLIFGLANLITGLLGVLIPWGVVYGAKIVILIRVLQGLVSGMAWPAMHNMVAKWIPPKERSKFISAYMGSSVGVALAYPVCGFCIDLFDWPSVFYLSGLVVIGWYLLWLLLVFDSPDKHPRIDSIEREDILASIGSAVTERKLTTPWCSILKSMPFWVNVISQIGGVWGLFTLLTQAPTYFKNVHDLDIRMIGILSGAPHVARILFSLICAQVGDGLLKSNRISSTILRKVATTLCTTIQGLFVLVLAFSGGSKWLAFIALTIATMLSGAASTGPLPSLVDLAPNFAAVLFGICNSFGVVPGFISPIVVAILTQDNQTAEQWQIVFFITSGILVFSGMLYVLFGSSELQSWNYPVEKVTKEQEMTNMIPKSIESNKKETDLQNVHRTELE